MDRPPLRLADLLESARALEPEAFAATHGRAFLLCHLDELETPEGPIRTWSHGDRAPSLTTPALQCLVFPLKKAEGSPFQSLISIGRTANNDVVLRDGSISKVHAVVTTARDGRLSISDAGSKGGTAVDDEAVPRRKDGRGLPLLPGATVRFGDLSTTYVEAEDLISLLERLSSQR